MVTIIQILEYLLSILSLIIFVQIVLSWLIAFNVINTHNEFVRQFAYALDRITEPLYRPFRRILPDFGGIDFAPFIVIIIIRILQSIVLPNMLVALSGGGM
jgi:YggT family protein